MRFLEFEGGCWVCLSHRTNKDGYFRRYFSGVGRALMVYRAIWEHLYGTIPEGYELHHKCNNRACCNPNHLELIDISNHKVISNRARYKERMNKAKEYWFEHQCTGTYLGEVFGVTYSTGCRWIRKWKAERS